MVNSHFLFYHFVSQHSSTGWSHRKWKWMNKTTTTKTKQNIAEKEKEDEFHKTFLIKIGFSWALKHIVSHKFTISIYRPNDYLYFRKKRTKNEKQNKKRNKCVYMICDSISILNQRWESVRSMECLYSAFLYIYFFIFFLFFRWNFRNQTEPQCWSLLLL